MPQMSDDEVNLRVANILDPDPKIWHRRGTDQSWSDRRCWYTCTGLDGFVSFNPANFCGDSASGVMMLAWLQAHNIVPDLGTGGTVNRMLAEAVLKGKQ